MATRKLATTTLTTTCTKEDELNALRQFQAILPSDSYLASLISDRLVDWFEGQMRSDFCCDIHEGFRHAIEAMTQSDGCVFELRQVVRNLETTNSSLETTIANLKHAHHEMAEFHRQELNVAYAKNEKMTDWCNEQVHQQLERAEIAEAKVAAQEQEILRLKARLFDLMDK